MPLFANFNVSLDNSRDVILDVGRGSKVHFEYEHRIIWREQLQLNYRVQFIYSSLSSNEDQMEYTQILVRVHFILS